MLVIVNIWLDDMQTGTKLRVEHSWKLFPVTSELFVGDFRHVMVLILMVYTSPCWIKIWNFNLPPAHLGCGVLKLGFSETNGKGVWLSDCCQVFGNNVADVSHCQNPHRSSKETKVSSSLYLCISCHMLNILIKWLGDMQTGTKLWRVGFGCANCCRRASVRWHLQEK